LEVEAPDAAKGQHILNVVEYRRIDAFSYPLGHETV
jgi:hypothetical protein